MFGRNRQKDFKSAIEMVFSTESGKRALAYLKEIYLDNSCRGESVEDTYYNLGKQDLVKDLIATLESPEDLSNVETVKYTVGEHYE